MYFISVYGGKMRLRLQKHGLVGKTRSMLKHSKLVKKRHGSTVCTMSKNISDTEHVQFIGEKSEKC